MAILLALVLAALGTAGCATGAAADDETPRFEPPQPDSDALHSEWKGGGTFPLSDVDVDLPADPGLILTWRPNRIQSLVDRIADLAISLKFYRFDELRSVDNLGRSGLLRLLPKLLLHRWLGRYSPNDRDTLLTLVPTLATSTLGALDTEEPAALAFGLARLRPAIRAHRLKLDATSRLVPSHVAVRFVLPATQPSTLATQFRRLCRRPEQKLLEEARERYDDDSELQTKLAEIRNKRTCGTIRRIETRGDHVIADVLYNHRSLRSDAPDTRDRQVERLEERQLRPTPAFQALRTRAPTLGVHLSTAGTFGWSSFVVDAPFHRADVAGLLPSTGTRNRSRTGATLLWPEAVEFEDTTILVESDTASGVVADIVQTYTQRGERVDRAGQRAVQPPRDDHSTPLVAWQHGWTLRRAAERARTPRWLEVFKEDDGSVDLGGSAWTMNDWTPVLTHTAYPTGVAKAAKETEFPEERLPTYLYQIAPIVGRAHLDTDEQGDLAGEAVARMPAVFPDIAEDWVGDTLSRWRVGAPADGVDSGSTASSHTPVTYRWGAGTNRDDRFAKKSATRTRYELEVDTDRLPSSFWRAVANLEDRWSDIHWSRLADELEAADRLRVVSDAARAARRTRIHLGSGETPDRPPGRTDLDLRTPDPPPPCYTSLLEKIRRFPHRAAAPYDGIVSSFEADRKSCEDLDARAERDLKIAEGHARAELSAEYILARRLRDAARLAGEACRLGFARACDHAESLQAVRVPSVEHVHIPRDPRKERYSIPWIAAEPGVRLGDWRLVPWSELDGDTECPTVESAFIARGRAFNLPRSDDDGDDEPPVIPVAVDRSAPADRVVQLAQRIRTASRVGSGRDPSNGSRLGAVVRRPASTRSRSFGRIAIRGRNAPDDAPRVRVTLDGLDVRTGNESVAPVDGCPSDGPTVCLTDPAEPPMDAAESLRDIYRNSSGPGDRPDRLTDTIVDAFQLSTFEAVVSRLDESSEASAIQFVVDPRIPFALIARLAGRIAYETRSLSDTRETEQVTDEWFPELFVKLDDS